MPDHQSSSHMLGLRTLPRLVVHTPVVTARFRGHETRGVSSLAEPVLDGPLEATKPLFSSRAKIAEACPTWLRQSKSR